MRRQPTKRCTTTDTAPQCEWKDSYQRCDRPATGRCLGPERSSFIWKNILEDWVVPGDGRPRLCAEHLAEAVKRVEMREVMELSPGPLPRDKYINHTRTGSL